VVVKSVEVVVINIVVLMTDVAVDVAVGSERHSQAVVRREQANPKSPDGAPGQVTGVGVVFVLGDVGVVFAFVVVRFSNTLRFSNTVTVTVHSATSVRFFLLIRGMHVLEYNVL